MMHQPNQIITDWNLALKYLIEGNKRYVSNQSINRNEYYRDREILKDDQFPFAAVLTCSDSRVSPEIYFDQKLGDIFVIRNAGNIASQIALGTLEFAVQQLNVPFVLVVGHSCCRAVEAAFQNATLGGNIQTILNTISQNIGRCECFQEAIKKNIAANIDFIMKNEIIKKFNTKVLGAFYDIESGEVSFDL